MIVGDRYIFLRKKIELFPMCGCSSSCRKVKYIWKSHFSRSLVQTCWMETTSLCLNTRLRVNNRFSIVSIFIEIKVNVWLFCAQPLMIIIIFQTRIPNSMKLQLSSWFLCFNWCPFFAFWGAENHDIHIAPFRSTRYVQKSFRCLEVSYGVSNLMK